MVILFTVLSAVASWMTNRTKLFIWLSGAAVIIFRAEVVILLGLLLAFDIFNRKIKIDE